MQLILFPDFDFLTHSRLDPQPVFLEWQVRPLKLHNGFIIAGANGVDSRLVLLKLELQLIIHVPSLQQVAVWQVLLVYLVSLATVQIVFPVTRWRRVTARVLLCSRRQLLALDISWLDAEGGPVDAAKGL